MQALYEEFFACLNVSASFEKCKVTVYVLFVIKI